MLFSFADAMKAKDDTIKKAGVTVNNINKLKDTPGATVKKKLADMQAEPGKEETHE